MSKTSLRRRASLSLSRSNSSVANPRVFSAAATARRRGPAAPAPPQGLKACRQTVVDDDDRAPAHVQWGATVAVADDATAQLARFSLDGRVQQRLRHPQPARALGVQHRAAVLGDRADPELGVARRTELAYGKDVQRRSERAGDLERDRHTTARQRDDDRALDGDRLQLGRQPPPSVTTIHELHRRILDRDCARSVRSCPHPPWGFSTTLPRRRARTYIAVGDRRDVPARAT